MGRDKGDLAPYAVSLQNSRGRATKEDSPESRSEFERDRDRVLHSKAFRRLQYKTQVFSSGDGDLYRTRLTHSLEVAQIGRSVAAALRLNEDLVESICLAHDLGHPPFGHAGQDELNELMANHGGFEHNKQALRVVDKLERRYAGFDGLNLLFETREGLLKRCDKAEWDALGDVADRFKNGASATLEAQVANGSDEIAYCCHDLDDGLESGILSLEECEHALPLLAEIKESLVAAHGCMDAGVLRSELVRNLVGWFVSDMVKESSERLARSGVFSMTEARGLKSPIRLSARGNEMKRAMKSFLMDSLYRDSRVAATNDFGRIVIKGLFAHFRSNPKEVPHRFFESASLERGVCDYVSGMTDVFAKAEAVRLL